MKHAPLVHRRRPLGGAVRAGVLGALVVSVAGLSCNAAPRFESAMADLPATADHGRDSAETTNDVTIVFLNSTSDTPAQSASDGVDEQTVVAGATQSSSTDSVRSGTPSGEQLTQLDGGSTAEHDTSAPNVAPSSNEGSAGKDTLSSSGETEATHGAATSPSVPSADSLASDSSEATEPVDQCPNQDEQLLAGSCGCGQQPDPMCDALRLALSHRYSFVSHAASAGYDSATIPDSVASADGTVHDAQYDWDGSLRLDGDDSYVQLPAGLLSGSTEATIDLWVKWWGGGENQRLLNFGVAPQRSGDAPDNYLSISPKGSEGVLTVQYRTDGAARGDRLETAGSMPTSDLTHLTVVIRERSVSLFVAGDLQASAETVHRLKDLEDEHNWLGRALYRSYPHYHGALFEFRVFSRALADDEVEKLDDVGLALP